VLRDPQAGRSGLAPDRHGRRELTCVETTQIAARAELEIDAARAESRERARELGPERSRSFARQRQHDPVAVAIDRHAGQPVAQIVHEPVSVRDRK
jgi:hypothetical protein